MPVSFLRRKKSSGRRGMVLLEATIALSIITVIGLVLLKLSLNILHPRQWILQQTLSDAYMTYERAFAERIPLEDLKHSSSEWPQFPTTSTTQVEIGRMPGGTPVFGTVVRTRIPDENNYPINGGTGTPESNPAALEVWRVQSVLTYVVGDRTYAKSRTVIRTQ
jgi:type II secretory pathway pseudopilin PulG